MSHCHFLSRTNNRRASLICYRFQNPLIQVKIKLHSKAYNHSLWLQEVKSKMIILNLSTNPTMRRGIQTNGQLA